MFLAFCLKNDSILKKKILSSQLNIGSEYVNCDHMINVFSSFSDKKALIKILNTIQIWTNQKVWNESLYDYMTDFIYKYIPFERKEDILRCIKSMEKISMHRQFFSSKKAQWFGGVDRTLSMHKLIDCLGLDKTEKGYFKIHEFVLNQLKALHGEKMKFFLYPHHGKWWRLGLNRSEKAGIQVQDSIVFKAYQQLLAGAVFFASSDGLSFDSFCGLTFEDQKRYLSRSKDLFLNVEKEKFDFLRLMNCILVDHFPAEWLSSGFV